MSIADFMFSRSVQKILSRVFSAPKQSFMLNELLECAGAGRGNGQRQIQRLINAGVLAEEPRLGRQRAICANQNFALFPELLVIYRKSFGLAEPIREALLPYGPQITEAFLFGSIATNEDTYLSDIDIMVIGCASFVALTEAMLKVEQFLGRPVHLNVHTDVEWQVLKSQDQRIRHIATGPALNLLPLAGPQRKSPDAFHFPLFSASRSITHAH